MSAIRRPLAFSSLGAPFATREDLARIAALSGVRAVELRCAEGELLTPDSSVAEARALGRELRSLGVEPVCVASYVRIARDEGDPVAEALAHAALAEAMEVPFVRVFGGVEKVAESAELAARRLAAVAAAMRSDGVQILLETHDVFLTGAAVAGILDRADSPRLGALWDAVNPWRAGEATRTTAALLAPWLRHVQLKDAASPTVLDPVLPGTGAVPLGEILDALDEIGYRDALAFEWERVWYPDIPSLEDALPVFEGIVARHERP